MYVESRVYHQVYIFLIFIVELFVISSSRYIMKYVQKQEKCSCCCGLAIYLLRSDPRASCGPGPGLYLDMVDIRPLYREKM